MIASEVEKVWKINKRQGYGFSRPSGSLDGSDSFLPPLSFFIEINVRKMCSRRKSLFVIKTWRVIWHTIWRKIVRNFLNDTQREWFYEIWAAGEVFEEVFIVSVLVADKDNVIEMGLILCREKVLRYFNLCDASREIISTASIKNRNRPREFFLCLQY